VGALPITETIAFLDFETTGLYADGGDRPTEVAVVFVESQRIIDRYQSLIKTGTSISSAAISLNGITEATLRNAPSAATVMRQLYGKISDVPVIAHNASFDRKFLETELRRIGKRHENGMYCSMRIARRVYPDARNHKLGTLVEHTGLTFSGQAHRAMADAEVTAKLWIEMERKLEREFGLPYVPFELMCRLQDTTIRHARSYISRFAKYHDFDVAEMPATGKQGPTGKNKLPQEIGRSILPENRVSTTPKPRDYWRLFSSSKGSRGSTSQKNSPPELKVVICVTCGDSVSVEVDRHHHWVKCPSCGFNTPQTP